MPEEFFNTEFGIGATSELSLRVSISTLVRVLFENPQNRELMLALERRATMLEKDGQRFVEVQAQPFGGAIRIQDATALENRIGDFHFDSEQSRAEQDFRLFIRSTAWGSVRNFCLDQWNNRSDAIIEGDPRRELAEEFVEVMDIDLQPAQYTYRAVGTVIEDNPYPSSNFYAREFLTVRMYRIFEAHIRDRSVATALVQNSARCSNDDLRNAAWEDVQNGGKGWANAALTLSLSKLSAFYEAIPPETSNEPLSFQGHQLDETVAAVLDHVVVPKYEKSFF